jgi:uncharacterized membrane protein
MTAALFAFTFSLISFVAIDAVWLKIMAHRTYAAEIGGLLRERPRVAPAVLFYLIFAAGLAIFSVFPGISDGSPMTAAASGAAMGLVAYGTFNLTNLAIMRGYSTKIAAVDTAWGVTASALTAGLAVWAGQGLL